MTIPLFEDYKTLARQWTYHLPDTNSNRLIRSTFLDGHNGHSISDTKSCLIAEIYGNSNGYAKGCRICNDFGYYFNNLIKIIPPQLKIAWWNTAKSVWKSRLLGHIDGVSIEQLEKIREMFNYYEKNIDTYGDLFNCFANNYIQHLAQCEYYANNVAIVR